LSIARQIFIACRGIFRTFWLFLKHLAQKTVIFWNSRSGTCQKYLRLRKRWRNSA
jgi:hypothetical protein